MKRKKRNSLNDLFFQLLIAAVLIALSQPARAQFFADKYDNLEILLDNYASGGTGDGYTVNVHINANAAQTDGAGPMMQSFIKMYHVTGDHSYLDKLIVQSKNLQDRRDNEPGVNDDMPYIKVVEYPEGTNNDVTVDKDRPTSPTWSQLVIDLPELTPHWLSSTLNAGGITSPMAEFIYLVRVEEPGLASHALPTLPSTDPSNVLSLSTYGEYADWLLNRIFETINYYDNPTAHDGDDYRATKWQKARFFQPPGSIINADTDITPPGYFLLRHGGWHVGDWNDDASLYLNDWNQQHAFAVTLLLLGETLKVTNPTDTRIEYIRMKLAILGRNFKEDGAVAVDDHYEWTFKLGDQRVEDISHAAESAALPLLCYEFGIENTDGDPLFLDTDIEKLTRSITESSYYEPMRALNCLDGTDYFYRPVGDGVVNYLRQTLNRWLPFVLHDFHHYGSDYSGADLYQITSEIFFDDYIINAENFDVKADYLLGVANLAYYQNLFDPIGANRLAGSAIAWAGVSGGDFDADGVDEYVTVSNFEGNFYIYEYVESHLYDITAVEKNANVRQYEYQIDHVASETSPGAASDWVDVVAGDFSPTHMGDEFVAVRNVDGKFYMYELVAGDIIGTASYQMGTGKTWVGLASGDFDADGNVEFAAIQDVTNLMYIFELDAGAIVVDSDILNNGYYLGAGDWRGLASGDFNDNGREELVSANNSNGDLVIFEVIADNITVSATDSSPGATSDWRDLTGGDFDGDGVDEFLAYRNHDGGVWVYERDGFGSIVSLGNEQFTNGQQIEVWGSGNFVSSLTNTREEIIALRNHDGDQLMYSLEGLCRKGHPCPIELNGNPPQRTSLDNSSNNDWVDFSNVSVYPNPSIGETTIEYDLAEDAMVGIAIYDLTGKLQLKVLDNTQQVAGRQKISVDAYQLSKGVYNVVVEIGENRTVKSIVIL